MIIHGDSLEILKTLEENSVDSIVTDPPYGLSFMGKAWDHQVPSKELWAECLRVLKPGGHLLSFAGTRTQHRMAVSIEDAGFEIRDMIAWVYGSGFPKSHNIGKAVDKLEGNEREVVREEKEPLKLGGNVNWDMRSSSSRELTKGNSPWEGWGTALKPALEPITVARKPFKGTVASNVLEHGTGGLNIEQSRVGETGARYNGRSVDSDIYGKYGTSKPKEDYNKGRFPANLIHDGSEEVVSLFPETGKSTGGRANQTTSDKYGEYANNFEKRDPGFGDSGSAARFFYCAKASKKDRNEGLEGFEDKVKHTQMRSANGTGDKNFDGGFQDTIQKNNHPTVKPTALMQYLVRLVTPPQGTVLDPFMGSGSTGKACALEGFEFIGIDLEEEYCEIAKARIASVLPSA